MRALGARMPGGCFVLSTNVGGLFLRAGFTPQAVRECHGSIHRLQCLYPCRRVAWPADAVEIRVDPATMRALGPLPACPHCGGLARPAVFAFGRESEKHRAHAPEDLRGLKSFANDYPESQRFLLYRSKKRLLQDGIRIPPCGPLFATHALVHADYSHRGTPTRIAFYDNRIEVESPGLLLPGLTIDDIKQGVSQLRNPVIARIFRELELIEQWAVASPASSEHSSSQSSLQADSPILPQPRGHLFNRRTTAPVRPIPALQCTRTGLGS